MNIVFPNVQTGLAAGFSHFVQEWDIPGTVAVYFTSRSISGVQYSMASVHPKFTDWHQSFSTESFWLMWWLWFQNFHFIDGLHFESDRYQSTMPFVSSGTSWIYNLRWHSYRKWIISISFPFVWPSQAFCKDVLLRFLVGTSDGYLNSVTSCFYLKIFFFITSSAIQASF